ncbi:hypothetical protein HWC80_gp102 [Mycobacterium phage Indlulamithi]|uniref:Uncharacterized protein n=1 Tax=Mycobacterium phage Indlulamithi TaxID=2656582 RepID=A0A649VCM9_9CAUD|nr:hypothetical protein HWC80_gp102 [Mycobacterium phage Indlulamithi]QGJ90110.1 hypothetical protein PBI_INDLULAMITHI_72 [Mycobacterium phage Indlulamithi]
MSSEITITLPLSVFGDASVDEVIKGIKERESAMRVVNELKGAVERQRTAMSNLIQSLNQIIESDLEPFSKFQQLRQLQTEANNFMRGSI